jgi:hypothetical protein
LFAELWVVKGQNPPCVSRLHADAVGAGSAASSHLGVERGGLLVILVTAGQRRRSVNRLVRRVWTCYRWQTRPRRRP